MHRFTLFIIALLAGITSGCASQPTFAATHSDCSTETPTYDPSPQEVEVDEIFTLLAYAVVYADWQTQRSNDARGYNIGSVLVTPENTVACWARNCVDTTSNETQHGEVRLMTNYLQQTRKFSLKGYRLYTTLEPCAMCSGMMVMTEMERTVFGQTDPSFGDAMQRLTVNTKACGGYCPYPRGLPSTPSTLEIKQQIDKAYMQAGGSITGWLTTDEAKQLYELAGDQFANYEVQFAVNQPILDQARAFLNTVPTDYAPSPYPCGG